MKYCYLFFLFFIVFQSVAATNSTFKKPLDLKSCAKGMVATASVGLSCEVVFTALYNYFEKRDKRLKGHTYLWMLPIYALVYPLHRLVYPKLSKVNSFFRYLVYVGMIYGVEFVSGKLLRKLTGHAPWEKYYKGKKFSVDNLIRLDYAPAWYVATMIFDKICKTCDDL